MPLGTSRLRLLLLLTVGVLPAVSAAQTQCRDCVIGLYDDPGLLQTSGRFEGDTKTIYLGVRFSSPYAAMTGIELSVSGLWDFVVDFEAQPDATFPNGLVIGQIAAPADPETATGGINVAWSRCQPGSRVLGTLRLINLGGVVGDDIVLRVSPRYPPTNARVPYPLFTQCNADYTLTAVAGGCYVINPTGGHGELVSDCPVRPTAVTPTAWTAVKSLYR